MAEQADKYAMSEQADSDAVPEQADHNALLQQADNDAILKQANIDTEQVNTDTIPSQPNNDTTLEKAEKDTIPKQLFPDNLLWLGTVGLDSQGRRSLAYLDKDTNQQITWSDLNQDIEDPRMRKLFCMLDEELCWWIGDDSLWPRPVQAMLQCLRLPIYFMRLVIRVSFLDEPKSWGGVVVRVLKMPVIFAIFLGAFCVVLWQRCRARWTHVCTSECEVVGVRSPLLKDGESYGTAGEVRLGDREKGLLRHASA